MQGAFRGVINCQCSCPLTALAIMQDVFTRIDQAADRAASHPRGNCFLFIYAEGRRSAHGALYSPLCEAWILTNLLCEYSAARLPLCKGQVQRCPCLHCGKFVISSGPMSPSCILLHTLRAHQLQRMQGQTQASLTASSLPAGITDL